MENSRVPRIQSILSEQGADAVWLSFLPDIRWACGFTGSNGILIVRRDGADFISDGRYTTQARREILGAGVYAESYDLPGQVSEHGLLSGCEKVLFQSDHVTIDGLAALEEKFPKVAWTGRQELLVKEVASKGPAEVEAIRRAQRISEEVLDLLMAMLRPGLSEKEVAAEIVYNHLRLGADSMSFDPVVASGPNSALPHARPSERILKSGEAVLLDFGCFLDGYASDMTRTVFLGEPEEEMRKVYDLVVSAQERAIAAAQAGISAKALDAAARDLIRKAGYAESFNHSLGHGVGLQIHEWPRVSYAVDYDLPAGCVVTVEPGVYLPGRFGVRVEDMILLKEGGCENLTQASKDLIVV